MEKKKIGKKKKENRNNKRKGIGTGSILKTCCYMIGQDQIKKDGKKRRKLGYDKKERSGEKGNTGANIVGQIQQRQR